MKVVGQNQTYNELNRIFEIFKNSNSEIRPHHILTGPSGSGKSFTVATLAKKHELKYLEVNAAQLTKEGTSGNSVSKALSPLVNYTGKQTIVFVDEFDKLFISGNTNSQLAHESSNGVQNEFLKILESKNASVFGDYGKYVKVPVNDVLFVFAGAFNGEEELTLDRLRELGIKTEFLGRVGLLFNLKALTIENLFEILDHSELLNNYLELFEDVDREQVLYEIKAHLQKIFKNNTLGARAINTLIHQYFINGKLTDDTVNKVTFQKKMKLDNNE